MEQLKLFQSSQQNIRAKQDSHSLPSSPDELAYWFSDAVKAEIEELSKKGRQQSYELLSGELIKTMGSSQGIFSFILADGTRIPEDATGQLKTESAEYTATVILQQVNRIQIQLEASSRLPDAISRAILLIDDTALLRRLADVLDAKAENPTGVRPLAVKVFHPVQEEIGTAPLPDIPALVDKDPRNRHVWEKACGSSVTYIWGPPGTGKTFSIAHLVATLIALHERVLVLSHTNAAVDQCLYEAVKRADSEEEKDGPLAGHPFLQEGKILRIGPTTNQKIPDHVRLDWVVDQKASNISKEIVALESKAKPLREQLEYGNAIIAEWDKLSDLANRYESAAQSESSCKDKTRAARDQLRNHGNIVRQRGLELEEAKGAWLFRKRKIQRASNALRVAQELFTHSKEALELLHAKQSAARDLAVTLKLALDRQRSACQQLLPREILEKEVGNIAKRLEPLETRIQLLQQELSELEQKVIEKARAIFCTLTKNYSGKTLEDQAFDAVIVDEISMALPPLIFLAAARAIKRIILVGDFCQLPPIVRSDTPISDERLGTDVFHLAGVAHDCKPSEGCVVLERLAEQRRMLPEIANIARHLVYNQTGVRLEDHQSLKKRLKQIHEDPTHAWLQSLPGGTLLIIDTADLPCWSGKQPGSLSRFNFYSATVAVETAALAVSHLPRPDRVSPRPIGIVTPFVAQRRLITRMLRNLELEDWVQAGTVHTFQGGQADLIIFDSVLDEPYWSARLITPRDLKEVRRELNVAVTRPKNKFIFIGSSEWLNERARAASGLGQLWIYLRNHADLVSAADLPIKDLPKRIFDFSVDNTKWCVPRQSHGLAWEPLDENTFFHRFIADINSASKSILAFAPYFGSYRWPRVQPAFYAALNKKPGVEITIVTPPLNDVDPAARAYTKKALLNLKEQGATVVPASGIHGKDVIIDDRVLYTGSMNWSSHRGRQETAHRFEVPEYVKSYLKLLQAKYFRQAAILEDGSPRVCPFCHEPTWVVNQRRQHGAWDFQAVKVACSNKDRVHCPGYLRNIDERPPFIAIPRCQIDGRTKYRRVRRGRGERWRCPKHPKECPAIKPVPGDP